jgi:hypothetical protein
MNAQQARTTAEIFNSKKLESMGIISAIDLRAKNGYCDCEYHSGDYLDDQILDILKNLGYTYEYNKYTYTYIISW